ncbi:MAG TPA: fibronectin type III domain-containing protein [Sideroxyarcus sp.]|nr:fibronectin type III domain-containing protein [Sideroxyarcus sp.]
MGKTRIVLLSCFCAIALTACLGSGGGGNPGGLSAPAGVNAAVGVGRVTVGWSPVTGATSYNTYIGRRNVSTHNYTWKVGSASSPATIPDLQSGTTYWAIVTATDGTSESSASSIVSFIPARLDPVGPISAVTGNSSVTLHWAALPDATGYQIQYATDADFVSVMQDVTTQDTSWSFGHLVNGATYFFRVRAIVTNKPESAGNWTTVSAIPNFTTGWNGMTTIANQWGFTGSSANSRTDSLNSNRDALCTWLHGESGYASIYTKAAGWGGNVTISNLAIFSASSLSDNGEGAAAWVERIYTDPNHTAYHDDVLVRHYQNGVWGSAIPLSGAESGSYAATPEIQLDKDGNGVAAWHGADGNFYVKTYDRTTNIWSATALLSTGLNPAVDTVRIGVDGSGGFVLTWSEKTATSTGVNGVLLRKYAQTGGWGVATERVNLDDPALNAVNGIQSLSVNTNGDVFVLWEHAPAANDHQLMLRRYAAATATWNNPVTVDTSTASLSGGKIKSNSATNAVISWRKTINNAGTAADSNNFAVYSETTGSIGPIEQMLPTDYAINTVDVVTDAANSFRMFYALSAAARAYERDYDIITQTWGTPVVIDENLGNDDFIATANATGEMMLTSRAHIVDNSVSWQTPWEGDEVRTKLYLPY